MIELPRKDALDVPETMFIRPRRPDDHREFEFLLPQMRPLFVYALDGQDWIRWSLPRSVAVGIGWGDMRCACCGDGTPAGDSESFHVDTALKEVDWFLERL